ncbi:MAG: hypothetical protein RLZZ457_422 [Pseudomonadota bacterium]
MFCSPAFSSDAKKPAAPVVEEKKFKYVEEEGNPGRSGYVYKRVARETFEEPKQLPKEEPKPAPKPEPKDSHGKPDAHGKPDDHGEKKKDDGHGGGDHKEPKKEEKKKDDKKKDDGHGGGHGGGHGKAEKKAEPTVSAVYDSAVIKLDGNNRPLTPSVQTNTYADYFLCRKTISEKYKKTVLDEINTFADRMGLPRAQDTPCMIKVAKPKTKFPGAIYIEFYVDEKAAKECIRLGECGSTRVVMLFPKDKTGLKSKDVYRSYVLTDEHKYLRSSFCVSPDGKLLGEKNCYVALHPDWLFN